MTAELRIDVGGVRLAVRRWPAPAAASAPPFLLLHGLASTSHIWDLVAPRLARAAQVVAYDQRGHGRSSKPGSGYGRERTAADALEVIRGLRLGRPIVVGHSWGASVALEVASRWPRRVRGIVLLDGGFSRMRDRMDWPTARRVLAPPAFGGIHIETFLAHARSALGDSLRVTPEIEAVLRSLIHVDGRGRVRPRLSRANHLRILHAMWGQDAPALLRAVRVPTLVLAARTRGDEGPFARAKARAAGEIRAIGGPVRFEWIEGIHDMPLQRPEAVARRVLRFADQAVG